MFAEHGVSPPAGAVVPLDIPGVDAMGPALHGVGGLLVAALAPIPEHGVSPPAAAAAVAGAGPGAEPQDAPGVDAMGQALHGVGGLVVAALAGAPPGD